MLVGSQTIIPSANTHISVKPSANKQRSILMKFNKHELITKDFDLYIYTSIVSIIKRWKFRCIFFNYAHDFRRQYRATALTTAYLRHSRNGLYLSRLKSHGDIITNLKKYYYYLVNAPMYHSKYAQQFRNYLNLPNKFSFISNSFLISK